MKGKAYENDHGLFKDNTLPFVWTETERSINDHSHDSQCPKWIITWLKLKPTWCTIFLSMFISFLYMFRATVPIIRRNNCIYTTLGTCMDDCLVCIPVSHPYRIKSTKCHLNTVVSPDDGHIDTQNMYRKETY